MTSLQRRCTSCGGMASLAVQQATRTGRATYTCPACGAPNEVQLHLRPVPPSPSSAPDREELARIDRELRELRRARDPHPGDW
jgi:hypothetical protein